jgi:hypothetical protein
MTKFTVFHQDDSGHIYGRGLTAVEAMREILTYDGRQFEIRSVEEKPYPHHDLWSKNLNSSWTKTVVSSYADTRKEAEQEIAQKVIDAGWDRHPEAMLDADFDEMIARMAAENEE